MMERKTDVPRVRLSREESDFDEIDDMLEDEADGEAEEGANISGRPRRK